MVRITYTKLSIIALTFSFIKAQTLSWAKAFDVGGWINEFDVTQSYMVSEFSASVVFALSKIGDNTVINNTMSKSYVTPELLKGNAFEI